MLNLDWHMNHRLLHLPIVVHLHKLLGSVCCHSGHSIYSLIKSAYYTEAALQFLQLSFFCPNPQIHVHQLANMWLIFAITSVICCCCVTCSEATNGAEVVARMLVHIARHKGYIPIPEPPEEETVSANGFHPSDPPRGRAVARAGAGRLRDAIVFGYMMQRHRARGKVTSPSQGQPDMVVVCHSGSCAMQVYLLSLLDTLVYAVRYATTRQLSKALLSGSCCTFVFQRVVKPKVELG